MCVSPIKADIPTASCTSEILKRVLSFHLIRSRVLVRLKSRARISNKVAPWSIYIAAMLVYRVSLYATIQPIRHFEYRRSHLFSRRYVFATFVMLTCRSGDFGFIKSALHQFQLVFILYLSKIRKRRFNYRYTSSKCNCFNILDQVHLIFLFSNMLFQTSVKNNRDN